MLIDSELGRYQFNITGEDLREWARLVDGSVAYTIDYMGPRDQDLAYKLDRVSDEADFSTKTRSNSRFPNSTILAVRAALLTEKIARDAGIRIFEDGVYYKQLTDQDRKAAEEQKDPEEDAFLAPYFLVAKTEGR